MSKEIDFTVYSENMFYDAVDAESFYDDDTQTIYSHLQKKIQLVSFGDYLKRYIFKKAEFDGEYDQIDIKEYQQIIVDCFSENMTPKSFKPTTAKISALTKNWLTKASVSRNTVFLIGFGLGMSVDDVSEFLVNAQHERSFNFKNPFEIICWYCLKNGYKYPKFVQLYDKYEEMPANTDNRFLSTSTVFVKNMMFSVVTDEDLIAQLSLIKSENDGKLLSVTTKNSFDNLYLKTKSIIAQKFTDDERDEYDEKADEYIESARHSDTLSPSQIHVKAGRIRASARTYTPDDITDADVEKFICCGQPFDSKGNLTKFSSSKLSKHFDNKRLSRQRLNELSSGKSEADRFDLITLNFFIFSMDDNYESSKKRYIDFCTSTNELLANNSMGKLYITNPYECFLLMCILSECPMGAYADVMEKSFYDDPEN